MASSSPVSEGARRTVSESAWRVSGIDLHRAATHPPSRATAAWRRPTLAMHGPGRCCRRDQIPVRADLAVSPCPELTRSPPRPELQSLPSSLRRESRGHRQLGRELVLQIGRGSRKSHLADRPCSQMASAAAKSSALDEQGSYSTTRINTGGLQPARSDKSRRAASTLRVGTPVSDGISRRRRWRGSLGPRRKACRLHKTRIILALKPWVPQLQALGAFCTELLPAETVVTDGRTTFNRFNQERRSSAVEA
ncbi:hypothetical protein PHYPSEUDO_009367 [Phytophthora pseudosyringae]|uniref:Uncharacterized protein n=1 Tax=Phytophthora pseudosyringae TaxID=221518 RepID=A0A8T1WC86_9STRA|nr:hypothetical protein PHYPSEUDO_009367 [Phytophthora pseudosyringae]